MQCKSWYIAYGRDMLIATCELTADDLGTCGLSASHVLLNELQWRLLETNFDTCSNGFPEIYRLLKPKLTHIIVNNTGFVMIILSSVYIYVR